MRTFNLVIHVIVIFYIIFICRLMVFCGQNYCYFPLQRPIANAGLVNLADYDSTRACASGCWTSGGKSAGVMVSFSSSMRAPSSRSLRRWFRTCFARS